MEQINIQNAEPNSQQTKELKDQWLFCVRRLNELEVTEKTFSEMVKREKTEVTVQASRAETLFQVEYEKIDSESPEERPQTQNTTRRKTKTTPRKEQVEDAS